MRYLLLVCVLVLALALDLSVLIATSDDSLESIDPLHPATLLPIVANRMHNVGTAAGDLAHDLAIWVAAPYRSNLHQTLPVAPAPQ